MVLEHPYGEAKAILEFDQEKKPLIIQETIDEIFDHEQVKNRKIVIFSIIGAFRKGKSYFLDYSLRYLYANYESINAPNRLSGSEFDWMGASDEPLRGFSWRGGVDRETKYDSERAYQRPPTSNGHNFVTMHRIKIIFSRHK